MRKEQYDKSTHVFSPEGKIYQIEYAKKAIQNTSFFLIFNNNKKIYLITEKNNLKKLKLFFLEEINNKFIFIIGLMMDCLKLKIELKKKIREYEQIYGTNRLNEIKIFELIFEIIDQFVMYRGRYLASRVVVINDKKEISHTNISGAYQLNVQHFYDGKKIKSLSTKEIIEKKFETIKSIFFEEFNETLELKELKINEKNLSLF